jgi:prepilin-type N-terminal cleavage/methylation domain-containing protein
MNMKKMKKFFTLSRRAEGFTLVELIVVIAILAILGGVAVPAYGGYVKKANMQADMTLISEIEHALQLAYYSQDLTEGHAGFILLSPNAGESIPDEAGLTARALEKTFGANWLDMMQLKYSDWGVSWDTLSYEDANAVVNSNYVKKYSPDELMAQVQAMTDAVNALQLEVNNQEVELYNMFGYKDGETEKNAIDDVITELYGDSKEWDDFSKEEQSNLLVLATASCINDDKGALAVPLISQYAMYSAYAAENEKFNDAYQNFQTTINDVDPDSEKSQIDQIADAYGMLRAEATANGFEAWNAENGDNHQNAFASVMKGVGRAMDENGDAILSDLGNSDMFTSGTGYNLYNDYLSSVYATAGAAMNDEFGYFSVGELLEYSKGSVAVWYTVQNGILYLQNSLPITG